MFDVKKVLQMIAYLLELNGGRMNFLKLMKELYLIDRESIAERETSISGDIYYSLDHGPILSFTKNHLDDLKMNEYGKDNPFKGYLARAKEKSGKYFDVVLKRSPEYGDLSEKDMEYITTVSNKFKDYTPSQIREYTHKLPEWSDPKGSHQKIRFQDIMTALGRSQEEIATAKQEYDRMANLYKRLGI